VSFWIRRICRSARSSGADGPGEKMRTLGEKVAKHIKPNATLNKAGRPKHRVIANNQFTRLDTMDDVIPCA
jgi:hypothetical protein